MHPPDAENVWRPDQNSLVTKEDISVQVMPTVPTPEPSDRASQSLKPASSPSANSDGTAAHPTSTTPPPHGSG